ncbi:receptor-like protein EIX2 [Mangifera indica]|uniref:receptor-like protein EIX2 n=1 Tax=Mangifera indica TaxID=29780 RepID=UPI001CFBAB46|nr:receptor-like protein EIX2 [Mangifera indica]
MGCIESERQALVRLKQDLIDSSNRLASWTAADKYCCAWTGVICDDFTGHVFELHLGYPNYTYDQRLRFGGKINLSLLDLKRLMHLDLSGNRFEGIQIPKFLGSMKNLRYLDLSDSRFVGMVPPQLGNLSNLRHLNLGGNSLYAENLNWVSSLSSLQHLDLSTIDIQNPSYLFSMINTLPSLQVLRLSCCGLTYLPDPLPNLNFSSLVNLDLSSNFISNFLIPSWIFSLSDLVSLNLHAMNFPGQIPEGVQNLTSLRHLDLSANFFNGSLPNSWSYRFNNLEYLNLDENELQGRIPNDLGNLTSIKVLDLADNDRLKGGIPRSFENLCNLTSLSLTFVNMGQDISEILDIFSGCVANKLEMLNLGSCQLSGNLTNQLGKFIKLETLILQNNSISGLIPWKLGELSSLQELDLSFNKFGGSLFPFHFVNLTRLVYFDASRNSIMFKISPKWVPPFQLEVLLLGSCHLGPQFPLWVLSQATLSLLDVSNSGICDIIPNKIWEISSLFSLNFSHNQINGMIPNIMGAFKLFSLDLSWNNLSGSLPRIPTSLFGLDLSNNDVTGPMFNLLCYGVNDSKLLGILKLENNSLSGELPDCLMNLPKLIVLNLNNNNFTGKLPHSIGTLSSLESLHLHNNNFFGIIPLSLKGCTKLIALDLGENEFVGNVPAWIGESFLGMKFLNLRSNKFTGLLPNELCHLTSLQVLDLADNLLLGSIPGCISNLTDMVIISHSTPNNIAYFYNYANFVDEEAIVVMKGRAAKYNTILNLVRIIDFSKNKFTGEIPKELMSLKVLQSLNLSHNLLTGRIPENIGVMRSLECIDFSANQLCGSIPQSMSNLTFLSYLNLSNNNLIGKIPLSTQLQSLDASCFVGNELCGSPLPNNCTTIVPTPEFDNGGVANVSEDEVDWFYVSMALGFVVGFWSMIGPLVVNKRWSYFGTSSIQCCNTTIPRALCVYKDLLFVANGVNTVMSFSVQTKNEIVLGLNDNYFRVSEWVVPYHFVAEGYCCTWTGVICNNFTGHVIELHLGGSDNTSDERTRFGGKINLSLLDLERLIYLDLSDNLFEGIQILKFLDLMKNLRYLDLSALDSRECWIFSLGDLVVLNLRVSNFLGKIPDGLQNLTSRRTLDLSRNPFNGLLSNSCLYRLNNLEYLKLQVNELQGGIPNDIGNMTSIKEFDLSDNNRLEGRIPG